MNLSVLRDCQISAFNALSRFYERGGQSAACVMSVGAGKTVLGVAACLAFSRRKALILTPGNVIKGTFDRALDPEARRNALYGLPAGPLIPGCPPPRVLTLDRTVAPIRNYSTELLESADIVVTNFHSLGASDDPETVLGRLAPEDVDLIVVDEAHMAAADSYLRAFQHFAGARRLLMSACFHRLDCKTIDAEVVYRYRLIDSIADGHAKGLRVQCFEPLAEATVYEIVWPEGRCEVLHGRDAVLEVVSDERKMARITAVSTASIEQVVGAARTALDEQVERLSPIRPRVLFSAMGLDHAKQIAQIAEHYGIPCGWLHHSMTESAIGSVRRRFEEESGDLQGIVQLKMLGQGYDFPPVTVVVPMRPYGSFSEFYQFLGRGIRIIQHGGISGNYEQFLDIIYHSELGLGDHMASLCEENDMDLSIVEGLGGRPEEPGAKSIDELSQGTEASEGPRTTVLFERGALTRQILHDDKRVEMVRKEREGEVLAHRYAVYARTNDLPVSFEEYTDLIRMLNE